jgi:hypothetical protein
MLSHAHVIDAFGGITAMARAIGIDPKLATHWPRRGIPAKYWPCLEETEVGRKLGITASRLMRLPATAKLIAA